MSEFFGYVYILHDEYNCFRSVYPNFKQAYERLERLAKGNPIIDLCTDRDDSRTLRFEVIRLQGSYPHICKFTICRYLLNISDKDDIIPYHLVEEMIDKNKQREWQQKYGLLNDDIISGSQL